MTTEIIGTPEYKEVQEANFKSIATALEQALSEQVGGVFEAELTRLEHTHPGFMDDRLVLQFHVKDKAPVSRLLERSEFFKRDE